MASVKIQIDNKWVKADSTETILDVAKRNNIEIPHMCHNEQLKPYGSCFVCVVKVKGARSLQPSCATKVTNGMVITTRDEEIEKSRKMAVELLLSNHFADCLGPCKISCPADVDVQGYVALAALGKYKDAIKLIKQQNPFPTVCGRVCTRPCELNCRRDILDESVAVDDIKRFVADEDIFSKDRFFPTIKQKRPEKIAIVGAGPGGLTCAYYLAQEGYNIDVFEANEKAGGMLRYGIPTYRLPSEVLDKEIEGITGLGVKIHNQKKLGKDLSVDSLINQGYKAVFLALGAQASTHISIEGENLENVLSGIEFLGKVEKGTMSKLNGTVAVIGGGNTAIDAARTSLRMGAEKVMIIYRRTIKEMPANPEEIVAAQHEGVDIKFLNNPNKYIGKNGKVCGVECIKMELGEPDASGRRRPVPIKNSEFIADVDYIIEAIGQKPDLSGLSLSKDDLHGLKLSKRDTLEVNEQTMETNIPGVFSAGDVVLGAATAVEAIGGGKKAANGIHHHITGQWLEDLNLPFISRRENFRKLTPEDYINQEKVARHARPEIKVIERITNFKEVELAFPEKNVLNEAVRCLECGCKVFFNCTLQQVATEYQADQTKFTGEFEEYKKDKRHPLIEFDMNKCILCSKCIRVCEEVVGVNALGLVNRGFVSKVAPSLEKPLQETSCISCGQCVDICPTGAISEIYHTAKPGPWEANNQKTICDFCSVGCELEADVIGDEVIKVSTPSSGKANPFGNLCFKGRYGFRYSFDNEKIQMPYIRKNGKLEEVEWDEVSEYLVEKLKKESQKLNGENTSVVTSSQLTMEELYQLQKFGRMVLNTNNVGSADYHENILCKYGNIISSNETIRELQISDSVIVLGCDPEKSHPVVSFEINKYLRDEGNLFVVNEKEVRLAKKTNFINISKNHYPDFIKLLTNLLKSGEDDKSLLKKLNLESEIWNKIKSNIDQTKKISIVWELKQWSGEPLLEMISFIKEAKELGVKFLTLTAQANSNGMSLSGAYPKKLPGSVCLNKNKDNFSLNWHKQLPETKCENSFERINEKLQSLWIFGEDVLGAAKNKDAMKPLLDKIGFKLVADYVWSETAEMADVVLPLPEFFAKDGLLVNYENRLQKMKPAVKNDTQKLFIKLFSQIAEKLGYNHMPASISEIRGEIARSINWLDGAFIEQAVSGDAFIRLNGKKDIPENLPKLQTEFSNNSNSLLKYILKYSEENGLKL